MPALILAVFVIFIVALFSAQNAMPVTISFLAWQFSASLAIIALIFFLAGMITGMGVLSWIRIQRRTRKKRAEEKTQPVEEKPPDMK